MGQFVHFGPRICGDQPDHDPVSDEDFEVTCPTCRRLNGFALTTLTDGTQVYPEHREKLSNGQQRDYVVLSESERARGFIRPYRDSYKHLKCGTVTTMGRALSETYARDPHFYSGTFCCGCGAHFPVGEAEFGGEFVWTADGERVGT